MNKKGDLHLYIGLVTAVSLIIAFVSAANKWPNFITGIFGLIFIIAFIFWKFTR